MKKINIAAVLLTVCLTGLAALTSGRPQIDASRIAQPQQATQQIALKQIESVATDKRVKAQRVSEEENVTIEDFLGYWKVTNNSLLNGDDYKLNTMEVVRGKQENEVLIYGWFFSYPIKGEFDPEQSMLHVRKQQICELRGDIAVFVPIELEVNEEGYIENHLEKESLDITFTYSGAEERTIRTLDFGSRYNSIVIEPEETEGYYRYSYALEAYNIDDWMEYWGSTGMFKYDPNEWVDAGTAIYADYALGQGFTSEVPCKVNIVDPKRILLINPYEPELENPEGFVYLEISDPECVLMRPLVRSGLIENAELDNVYNGNYYTDYFLSNYAGNKFWLENWDREGLESLKYDAPERLSVLDMNTHIVSINDLYVAYNDNLFNPLSVRADDGDIVIDLPDEVFAFYTDPDPIEPDPVEPDPNPEHIPLYIVGSADNLGWDVENPAQFTYNAENDTYTFEAQNLAVFKISNVYGDWQDFNDNSYFCIYGEESGVEVALEKGVSDQNIYAPWTGDYTITVAGDFSTITLNAIGDKPDTTLHIYLRGSMTGPGWEAVPEFEFTPVEGTTSLYELKGIEIQEGQQFKVADANWARINLGSEYIEESYYAPCDVSLVFNGYNLTMGETGVYDFRLELVDNGESNPDGILTIAATGELPEPEQPVEPEPEVPGGLTLYLVGEDVNGTIWDNEGIGVNDDARMIYRGDNIYEWSGETLGSGFRIFDGAWFNSYDFGAPWEQNIVSLETPLSLTNRAELGATIETCDLYFDNFYTLANPHVILDLNNMTLTVSGEKLDEYDEDVFYVRGDFNNWDKSCPMTLNEDGIYVSEGVEIVESEGRFKIGTYDWKWDLGSDGFEEMIDSSNNAVILVQSWDPFYVNYILTPGIYTFSWNRETGLCLVTRMAEEPVLPTEPVKVTVKVENGFTSVIGTAYESTVTIGFDLDEYWKLYEMTLNGEDVAEDVVNNMYTTPTLEDSVTIEARIEYVGTLEVLSASNVVDFEASNIKVSLENGRIKIEGLNIGEEIVIYNLTGQIVGIEKATDSTIYIGLENGIYIVRIGNDAVKVNL